MHSIKQNLHPRVLLKFWSFLCLIINVLQQPLAVGAIDDVANVSPCELETIINQLINPSPQYRMHVAALRNQLRNILQERQFEQGEEQNLLDENDDYGREEDKRSVAALAAQGLLNHNHKAAAAAAKRSLATLAKNGQLPTTDPNIIPDDEEERTEDKRYVGALARSGGLAGYGKRNIGTLARDYQLPQNGKRNLATMARLGMLGNRYPTKRNLAALARYNSQRYYDMAEKRSLAALKASPVHGGGFQQKRADIDDEDEVYIPAEYNYVDPAAYYWNYATYADLDWGDFGRAQKRFLDTSKDPELFGIENAVPLPEEDNVEEFAEDEVNDVRNDLRAQPSKRHIGSVYRSGFLPSYRALRGFTGGGGGGGGGGDLKGRFSRSGRARQFVEYYPQHERLRQPIAAVCKRCFVPYRPVVNLGAYGGIRGRWPMYVQQEDHARSINTNHLPSASNLRHPAAVAAPVHSWGTPPRITALNRRSLYENNNDPIKNNYQY
ncbi:neuropeptide-like precursor 1 isoform 1-T1 [Glossina fuscipes fuscipes]